MLFVFQAKQKDGSLFPQVFEKGESSSNVTLHLLDTLKPETLMCNNNI